MQLLMLFVFVLFVFVIVKLRRVYIRKKIKESAFNPEWIFILEKNVKIYNKLPDELKRKLQGVINLFVHEKIFSGYNGLEITDEIKVTIASQACLLVLNQGDYLYPHLKNIYVYPAAFKSMQTKATGMVRTIEEIVRIGESWQRGQVVLSWYHSKDGGLHEADGHNVVYHEFAHQLDNEDGAVDGTPILNSAENYASWSSVFTQEYNQLKNKVTENRKTLIDYYGAESEGEFFAVVTELFFECPNPDEWF